MELLLQKNELLDLGRGLTGTRIVCRAGVCWVTQEGDSRDLLLRPGMELQVRGRGRLLVTACAKSRLRFAGATHPSPYTWRQLCGVN